MGLDQYAYVAGKADTSWDDSSRQELAYWRKHPNLQGWMEKLWLKKLDVPSIGTDQFLENRYPPHDFNGVELELTWEDVDQLEKDIRSGRMASLNTTGFFFGRASDDHYMEQDLQFCVDAKAELFLKRRVFYYSSW